jgi:hypothetical protein
VLVAAALLVYEQGSVSWTWDEQIDMAIATTGGEVVHNTLIYLSDQDTRTTVYQPAPWCTQSVKQFIDPADIAALCCSSTGPDRRTISRRMVAIDGDSKSTQ